MEWFVLICVLAAVCGGLGAWIATQKRRSISEGLMLGLLFGPLGVLIEALLLQGAMPLSGPVGGGRVQRNIDEEGIIAEISERFRSALEETDPNWLALSYHRKRAVLRPIEKRVMKELKLSPTAFADYAAEARRSVLGVVA